MSEPVGPNLIVGGSLQLSMRLSGRFRVFFPFLPAATKLGQGNVFTGVCDSVHRGGLPQCMLGYHHPPEQTTPPGPDPPGADTPRSRHPQDQSPPPWEQTPLEQTPPLGADPPPGSRLRHTVNERPVHILLECILVAKRF